MIDTVTSIFTRERKGVIDMVLSPLDLLAAIPTLALLSIILLSYLLRGMSALYGPFSRTPIMLICLIRFYMRSIILVHTLLACLSMLPIILSYILSLTIGNTLANFTLRSQSALALFSRVKELSSRRFHLLTFRASLIAFWQVLLRFRRMFQEMRGFITLLTWQLEPITSATINIEKLSSCGMLLLTLGAVLQWYTIHTVRVPFTWFLSSRLGSVSRTRRGIVICSNYSIKRLYKQA
jgi:hypothetical protein